MLVSHDLCTTPNTNWSRDHLECDHNTQDLSSVGTDLVELHDRPRSVGRTEVFMECDWGLTCLAYFLTCYPWVLAQLACQALTDIRSIGAGIKCMYYRPAASLMVKF